MTSTTSVTSSSSGAEAVVDRSGTTSTTAVNDSVRVQTIASRTLGAGSAATISPAQNLIQKYVVVEALRYWPWVSGGTDPYTDIIKSYGGV